ncbi:MAG TPA: hypothetical protein VGJ84_04300 [Polyangiaceae bacterium]|jgi:hypothetical protein
MNRSTNQQPAGKRAGAAENRTAAARPSPDSPDAPRVRRPRRPEEEPLDALGGRFWIALALAGLMVVTFLVPSSFLTKKEPAGTDISKWKVGSTQDVRITVVTADYTSLQCAAAEDFGGTHCEYRTETENWPRAPEAPVDDNKRDTIQPYRTWLDNQLIFIAGLWSEPHVAYRLHQEPSQGILATKLARFVVRCKVSFVGQLKDPSLRWFPSQAWQKESGQKMVARVVSCQLVPGDED